MTATDSNRCKAVPIQGRFSLLCIQPTHDQLPNSAATLHCWEVKVALFFESVIARISAGGMLTTKYGSVLMLTGLSPAPSPAGSSDIKESKAKVGQFIPAGADHSIGSYGQLQLSM
ncbi:hypothetical protein K3217_28490 [bacterium BD-1]|nr:hypothetical protein [Ottowia caeni]